MRNLLLVFSHVTLAVALVGVLGCGGGGKKQGEAVAKALCADPSPLKNARRVKDNTDIVNQPPTKQDITDVCDSFIASMKSSGVQESEARSTLGAGGKTIWQGTVAPNVQRDCSAAASAEDVGVLAALLLVCAPMGIWK